ncbi:MAG: hypothetical protein M1829_005716 [Trizodia sp. TS-e1964]|nr:MAG: hypothetical protein M1829_005716 [Trizodia sp. TS-e1964]
MVKVLKDNADEDVVNLTEKRQNQRPDEFVEHLDPTIGGSPIDSSKISSKQKHAIDPI